MSWAQRTRLLEDFKKHRRRKCTGDPCCYLSSSEHKVSRKTATPCYVWTAGRQAPLGKPQPWFPDHLIQARDVVWSSLTSFSAHTQSSFPGSQIRAAVTLKMEGPRRG